MNSETVLFSAKENAHQLREARIESNKIRTFDSCLPWHTRIVLKVTTPRFTQTIPTKSDQCLICHNSVIAIILDLQNLIYSVGVIMHSLL